MKKILLVALIATLGISCSTPDVQTEQQTITEPVVTIKVAKIYASQPPFPGTAGATVNGISVAAGPLMGSFQPTNVNSGDVIKMWGSTVSLIINNIEVVPPTVLWGPNVTQTSITYTVQ